MCTDGDPEPMFWIRGGGFRATYGSGELAVGVVGVFVDEGLGSKGFGDVLDALLLNVAIASETDGLTGSSSSTG